MNSLTELEKKELIKFVHNIGERKNALLKMIKRWGAKWDE